MPKLKPNEAICHECEGTIDLDNDWEYTLIDGKYYHFKCFNSDDIYEQAFVNVQRLVKSFDKWIKAALKYEGDNNGDSVELVPFTDSTYWQGKDDD